MSEADVGRTFIVSEESDVEFSQFATMLTDGADQYLNQNVKFAEHAEFEEASFTHRHRDVLESQFFQADGNMHSLFVGPDLTGFLLESISLTLTSFDGGPGFLDIDKAEFMLAYHGRFRADFDNSQRLDLGDVQLLSAELRTGGTDLVYDVDGDGALSDRDLEAWVTRWRGTYFGDANLDGEFNSSDLVEVFRAGEYEDEVVGNSTWSTGDWNADGDFNSGDLVLAFAGGGYESGSRDAGRATPEPTCLTLGMIGLMGVVLRSRIAVTSR